MLIYNNHLPWNSSQIISHLISSFLIRYWLFHDGVCLFMFVIFHSISHSRAISIVNNENIYEKYKFNWFGFILFFCSFSCWEFQQYNAWFSIIRRNPYIFEYWLMFCGAFILFSFFSSPIFHWNYCMGKKASESSKSAQTKYKWKEKLLFRTIQKCQQIQLKSALIWI